MQNEYASDLAPKERRIARLITKAAILRSNLYKAHNPDYNEMRAELRQVEAELRALLPILRLD